MRKLFRERKNGKITNNFLLLCNDLKFGMVPELTLIQNSKMINVTKFQVVILKNDEVTERSFFSSQREIGLIKE